MTDIVPFNHPLAVAARSLAHNATYGHRDQVLVCQNDRDRHLLIIALLDWCNLEGWACMEGVPGCFHLRNAKAYIVRRVDHLIQAAKPVNLSGIDLQIV